LPKRHRIKKQRPIQDLKTSRAKISNLKYIPSTIEYPVVSAFADGPAIGELRLSGANRALGKELERFGVAGQKTQENAGVLHLAVEGKIL
jgi:hypothetical protein